MIYKKTGINQERHSAFPFLFGNPIGHSSVKLVRESGNQNEGYMVKGGKKWYNLP